MEVIQILTPLLFCLISGYMLSFLQRGLEVLERIEAKVERLSKQRTPEVTGDPVDDLIKAGMYTLGKPDKEGMQPLIALNRR